MVVGSQQGIIPLNKQWLLLPVLPEKHLLFDGRDQGSEEAVWVLKIHDGRRTSRFHLCSFTLCLHFFSHFCMLSSFLRHVPVQEKRELKQSTSNTTSRAHGPKEAPLALSSGISEHDGNSSAFRCSLLAPSSRKRKAHSRPPVLSQTSPNFRRLYWEPLFTEAQIPQPSLSQKPCSDTQWSAQQTFTNAGIHPHKEPVADWSSVARGANY